MDAPVPQRAQVGGVMNEQIDDLQARIAHQDAAIDELTAQSLRQQRQIDELIGHVERLQKQLKDLSESQREIIDAPPPHY